MSRPERPPWQRASALVFVDDLDTPQLDADDAHHLGRVLRLRSGDEVCATDGTGRWKIAIFDGRDTLSGTGEDGVHSAPEVPVTVGIALIKGQKPDLVVQKLTEVGVDRIVFFGTERSIVRWDLDKQQRNVERLERISLSACGQSRRLFPPLIEFGDLGTLVADGAVVADFSGRPVDDRDTILLVGPEGGWADGEYGDAETVDLGPNVLRAETAAIVAGIHLTMRRSGHSA